MDEAMKNRLEAAASAMYELLLELVNADLLDPDDEFTQSVESVLATVRGA